MREFVIRSIIDKPIIVIERGGEILAELKRQGIAMKDEVNRIGKTHGYTETDFRKRGKNSRTSAEKKIILNGGTSWKEELREVIAEGIKRSKTPEAFKEYLNKCYGVKITRDGKDYSYLHPNKKQSEGRGSEHIIRKAR